MQDDESKAKNKIIHAILYLAAQQGRIPSGKDFSHAYPDISFKSIKDEFGSFNQALKAAGVDKWSLHKDERDQDKSKYEIIKRKYMDFIMKNT